MGCAAKYILINHRIKGSMCEPLQAQHCTKHRTPGKAGKSIEFVQKYSMGQYASQANGHMCQIDSVTLQYKGILAPSI